MATGKTAVGRELARRLNLPFVDLDDVLAGRFGPVATQWTTDGEAEFRSRERDLVLELCDGVARVLATGGGTWVDPENRQRLGEHYRLVVLRAPLDALRARVGADGDGRPLWSMAAALLEARAAAYADAELVVDTGDKTIEEVAEEVSCWVSASK